MPKLGFRLIFKKRLQMSAWVIVLLICSQPAFSQRTFALRTPAFNIKGDAVIVGNRVIAGASAAKDNNATTISNIDLDGDATTTRNSSSADLTLPVGSTVAWAGLYWAGRSLSSNKKYYEI